MLCEVVMKYIDRLHNRLRRLRYEIILLPALVPILSITVLLADGREWDTRVNVFLTSENIQEYFQHLNERQIESVLLTDMKPALISPDSSTIWFNGDVFCIEWQGYAAVNTCTSEYFIEDRTSYCLYIPLWDVVIELYRDDTFIESIYGGPWSNTPDAPFQLDSHYIHHQFKSAMPSRVNLQFGIGTFQSGDDYRLRFVFDQSDREGLIHTEVWSSVFTIADPWLEITEPNAITTWRQDSLDIHIAFKNHGSFGIEYPYSIDPWVSLYRNGIPIDTLSNRSYDFSDQVITVPESLPSLLTVLTEWGTGDDFQICLSQRGSRYFSDFFSISGQMIDVILPVEGTIWSYTDDPSFEICWEPTNGDSITISLHQKVDIDYLTLIPVLEQIEVLATNVSDSGSFTVPLQLSESGWEIATYRIKIENELGEYGWSSYFFIKPYWPIP